MDISQVPVNWLVPGRYFQIQSSGGVYTPGGRSLMVGQRRSTGEAPALRLDLVTSPAQATALYGVDSMLASMAAVWFKNHPFGELWCLPLDDLPAGVAASGTITISGTATQSGLLDVYIGGVRTRTAVTSGQTAAQIATAVTATINVGGVPVTASAAGAVVTLTARHKGTLGNSIDLRLNYYGQVSGERTPPGLTVGFIDMAGGAGDPDIAPVLALIGDNPWPYLCIPYTDGASVAAIHAAYDARYHALSMAYGQVFSGRTGSINELVAWAAATAESRYLSVQGAYRLPSPPWLLAAAYAAEAAWSLTNSPARPLQTLPLVGILPPAEHDRWTASERNILLGYGIATATVNAAGQYYIEREVTRYLRNEWGRPDGSYRDVTTLATLTAYILSLRARLAQLFPRHMLVDDGTPIPPGMSCASPMKIRAAAIAHYAEVQTAFLMVEDIAGFRAQLVVQRSSVDRNKVEILLPPNITNQLRTIAVLVDFTV